MGLGCNSAYILSCKEEKLDSIPGTREKNREEERMKRKEKKEERKNVGLVYLWVFYKIILLTEFWEMKHWRGKWK